MFDLVELQRKLQEARNEKMHTPNSGIISKYRLRTAAIEKDAIELLQLGVNPSLEYFQYALAIAITSAVGLLIAQWFELQEPSWVLITLVVILMPVYTDISLSHR